MKKRAAPLLSYLPHSGQPLPGVIDFGQVGVGVFPEVKESPIIFGGLGLQTFCFIPENLSIGISKRFEIYFEARQPFPALFVYIIGNEEYNEKSL